MKTGLIIGIIIFIVVIGVVVWYFGFYKKAEEDTTRWKYIGENKTHTVAGKEIFNLQKYSYYTTIQKDTAIKTGLVTSADFVKSVLNF